MSSELFKEPWSDLQILESFLEHFRNWTTAEAMKMLKDYLSQKGNSLLAVLALLFQSGYMDITEYTIEQVIAQVKNQSTESVTICEAWIQLPQFTQPTKSDLSDLFNEL